MGLGDEATSYINSYSSECYYVNQTLDRVKIIDLYARSFQAAIYAVHSPQLQLNIPTWQLQSRVTSYWTGQLELSNCTTNLLCLFTPQRWNWRTSDSFRLHRRDRQLLYLYPNLKTFNGQSGGRKGVTHTDLYCCVRTFAYCVDFTEISAELLRIHGMRTRLSRFQKRRCVNVLRESAALPHYFPWNPRNTRCSNVFGCGGARVYKINGKLRVHSQCTMLLMCTVLQGKRANFELHQHA